MLRSRLKNIINKSKTISNKQEVGNPFDLFKKSLPIEVDDNYRLEAAWKAYGKPKDYKEALWLGLIQPIDENNVKLPSIGYNEETDEYEYLNKGEDNETVAKDIRVWDNDVIPLVQELKLGGYVRTFNKEKDCWTYTKNLQKRELPAEDKGEQVIDSFLEGGNVQKKYTLPEMFLSRNINGISIKYSNPYLPNSFNSQKDVDDFISKYSKYSSWVINDPNSKYKNLRVQSGILRDGGSHEVNIYDDNDSEDLWNLGGIIEDNGVTSTENDKKLASERKTKLNDFLKPYGILFNNSSTQTFKQGGQMNVIPEGALHARKNNMEGAGEDFTAKGIPVVDNNGEQVAEIEREEIIFCKRVTDKIEEAYKKFNSEDIFNSEKDELAIKIGKFLTKEILENTEDNTNLILEVELKM